MADQKISELNELTTVDSSNDVLAIVDVSDTSGAASGTTKKVKPQNFPISDATQTALGLKADQSATYIKTEVSTSVDKFMQSSGKRDMQDLLVVPLPYAAFAHTLTKDQWRKAAKFTSTKSTAIAAIAKSTTGYAVILNHDGTWGATGQSSPNASAKVGSGNPVAQIAVTSKSPPADNKPSFYAILPCDASGNLDGELTYLQLDNNQLTSFDGTGLSAVTYLNLNNNQLTSFDGTGLSAMTELQLRNNKLTSFDGIGLSALTSLYLNDNQLTSFDSTGLSSVQILLLLNNLLTSFDGTALSSVYSLYLANNQLTSFDGTGMGSLNTLSISNNQLTSFDGIGLSSMRKLFVSGNQLASVLLPEFTGTQPYTWTTYTLNLSSQNMTTDAVYAMLDSIQSPAVDQPYPINLTSNPCDAADGPPPSLVEDGVHTQAEIEALLTSKGYSLQLTDGTIAP